jgi:hypothetical protein
MRKYTCLIFLPIFILSMGATAMFGQAVTGTIIGSVKDVTGAPVASITGLIADQATGVNRSFTTDANGEYVASLLQPGTYTISVESKGFKKTSLEGIQVGVDQKVRADVVLQLGSITETVQVEAAAPVIQSESSELAQTVTSQQIKDLPLNGRDFVQLTRIIPGVLRGIPGANIDGAGSLAWRASASFSANGQRTRDNNFMLDGVDNNDTWLNSVVIFPSVDALEEFKVQTSTFSAEFGRSSGGVVNIQIKSGANKYHASGFEFLRNDAFDANDLFNNKFGRAKPAFRQNQFGATLGGHIIRDKTFFFMDYQGWRIRQAQTYLSNVPSDLMRKGDFSELKRAIYDPTSRAQFPGNVIQASRFDKAAFNVINQVYPAANVAGQVSSTTGQTINNFLFNPSMIRNDDQGDVKVDHNFSEKNHAFVRYSLERTERFLPSTLPVGGDAGTTFGAGTGLNRSQSVAMNDTHAFSPHLLNEFRAGFSRFGITVVSIDAGKNLPDTLGIPGVHVSDTTTAMSQLTFANSDFRNIGANGNQPLLTFLDSFQYFDNLTYIAGRHTLKGGFSYTYRRRNVFNVDNIVGTFNFQPNLTSNCAGATTSCSLDSNTGFSGASFLLGNASTVSRAYMLGTVGERRPEYGAYFQDDFRVSNRLTVNLGIRYDVFVPYVEVHDRQANFDTSTGRFVVASDSAVINGQQVGRGLQFTPKLDFAPRVGFAYDATGGGKMLLRGGYGIFWNNPLTGTSSSKPDNPPFLLATSLSTPSKTPFLPTLKLSDGLPAVPSVNPSALPTGNTRSIFDINFRDGYAQQWNFNIQRQFGKDYLWEVAYVGSKGTHLVLKRDINVAPPVVGISSADVNRPYISIDPGLRSLSQVESLGYSIYHSLQSKFTKRFSNGLTFVNSYTWGKTIDIVSDTEGAATNPYNFNYDRGVADFDIKHNFTSTFNYELPFGKGKKFAGSTSGLANKLIGGWQLNMILSARTGLPYSITQQTGVQSTGTGNRPNRLADGSLSNPTTDHWFDPAAFLQTGDKFKAGDKLGDNSGTYGNAGRNILRQPGQVNLDFSLIKNTKIGERFTHEFRAEFFNALNHPQFGKPGSTLGASDQGVISALLFNTPMRQIQLAMRLSF